MKKRKDAVHVAAETIKKLYDPPLPDLVEQVKPVIKNYIREFLLVKVNN